MAMSILPESACRLDQLSLGECMIRLSPPPHERLEFARHLEVHVGGGEYNVAYAAARLGLRTGWAGAVVDNYLAPIILNHARAAGMDLSAVVRMPFDGVGRAARIGLNFTEVGTSVRPSVTLYDRGHTATCQLKPGDIDWKKIFAQGVRWLHTGGIFTALSHTTRQVALEAVRAAAAAGTVVSYDLNFRASLWSIDDAIAATAPLLPHVNCFIGNIGQFQIVLGKPVEGFDLASDRVEPGAFEGMVKEVTKKLPQVTTLATTLREVRSGLVNDFSAMMWHEGKIYHGLKFPNLEIEDRIGGGDGFAAGLIYGLLSGQSPQTSINLGSAYGALLHTTPGDTSQTSLAELLHTAGGGSAKIRR